MKTQLLLTFVSILFFWGCENQPNETSKKMVETELKENINDSLKKYKVENINDTCIKYLYGINGFKVISGSDSVIVGMCNYVPWRIRQENDSIVFIIYILYYHDTIPMRTDYGADENFHSFDINTRTQKIEKVFLGQETSYQKVRDFLNTYNKEIRSQKFKNNFKKYFPKLHPEFKHLFADMANTGASIP